MKKITLMLTTSFLMVILVSSTVFAATGYQGYAVYREGNGANLFWHAAMMDDSYVGATLHPVIHANAGTTTKFGTWDSFLSGQPFKGLYDVPGGSTSSNRDAFVATGRDVRWREIPYILDQQMSYNRSTAGTYVDASEITGLRCDGVVEYVYEWNNFRIIGRDRYWDISVAAQLNIEDHQGILVNPKAQAGKLKLITSKESDLK